MRAKLSSRSVTPLVEILIVLFFFAFVCTVILEMFASADAKSQLAADINGAAVLAQNCAETIRGRESTLLSESLPGFQVAEAGGLRVFTRLLDRQWNGTQESGARYLMEIKLKKADSTAGILTTGILTVYGLESGGASRQVLIELPLGEYTPGI